MEYRVIATRCYAVSYRENTHHHEEAVQGLLNNGWRLEGHCQVGKFTEHSLMLVQTLVFERD